MDRDSPGGKPDHPIAPPYRQLLIDAFARHADKGGQFLLRQPDIDLDTTADRFAEPLGQPHQTPGQPWGQIQEQRVFQLLAGLAKPLAQHGQQMKTGLRTIGQNRSWTKNYGVIAALTRNPKTPLAVSMRFVQRLSDRDLKMISLDRNLHEPLKLLVRKRMAEAQEKK